MPDDDPRFVVDCPDCSMSEETDDMRQAMTFSSKHKEHTGHDAEWVKADFGEEFDIDLSTVWWVQCDHCENAWQFDSESHAEGFYHDHTLYTDHHAKGPIESTRKTADTDDVRKFIREYCDHDGLEHGIPLPLLFKTLSEKGVEHSEISQQVDQLKSRGEIYEPRVGYLRAT